MHSDLHNSIVKIFYFTENLQNIALKLLPAIVYSYSKNNWKVCKGWNATIEQVIDHFILIAEVCIFKFLELYNFGHFKLSRVKTANISIRSRWDIAIMALFKKNFDKKCMILE